MCAGLRQKREKEKEKRKGESRKNNLVLFDKRSNSTINREKRASEKN